MLACPSCGSVYARSQEFCGLDGTRLEEMVSDPILGRKVGRYVIEQPLGAGGMARVYRGCHEVLEQQVAIKVLHGELSADKHLAKRFEREARSLSRIRHPNVVEVLDFGRTEAGVLYMVMELVDGHTLAEALRRAGPLPPSEAGRIVADIARGLGAAHEVGYVHRDLKPGNVVLDVRRAPSAVKILDFGLVGLVEGTESDTPLTRQGTFFGTPTYMSPEQSAGEKAVPASDMYALGIVLYELLTGSPPFLGDIRQLAQQHLQAEPPRPPLEYGGLTQLALGLLEKHPDDRPTSRELVDAVERLPLTVPPTMPMDPDPTPVDERPAWTSPPRPTPASASPRESARAMPVIVPIERDEFSVMDGTSHIYEREALGPTRRGRWVLAALFALVAGGAGYGVWRYENRGPPPRSAPAAAPAPDPIDPEQLAKLAKRDRSPTRTRPPRREKRRTEAKAPPPSTADKTSSPPKSTSAPKSPPIPNEPPRAETPETKKEAPALPAAPNAEVPSADEETVVWDLYAVHDAELGAALMEAGLQWADLQAVEPTITKQWSQWHQAREPVPKAAMLAAKTQLEEQIERIGGDGSRQKLALRLIEVRKSFRALPDGVPPLERSALRERFRSLEEAISKEPLEAPPKVLRAQIEVLEADIRRTHAAAPPEDEDLDRSLLKIEVETATQSP